MKSQKVIRFEAVNTLKDGSVEKGAAVFSSDGKYRYTLEREWDRSKPKVCFLMLNPSKANHETLDPTNTRCRNFAKDWGYGSMITLNVFALVSTDPTALKKSKDPVGVLNDDYISKLTAESKDIILAWGNHGLLNDREQEIFKILGKRKLKCIKINKSGTPCHPLYLKSELKPIAFK